MQYWSLLACSWATNDYFLSLSFSESFHALLSTLSVSSLLAISLSQYDWSSPTSVCGNLFSLWFFFFKLGHSCDLFLHFRLFDTVLIQLIINEIVDDWIRTTYLWCQTLPLYQLRHNHCPLIDLSYSNMICRPFRM